MRGDEGGRERERGDALDEGELDAAVRAAEGLARGAVHPPAALSVQRLVLLLLRLRLSRLVVVLLRDSLIRLGLLPLRHKPVTPPARARLSLLLRRAPDTLDGALERDVRVAPLEDNGRDGAVWVELPLVRGEVRRGDRGIEEVVEEERDVRGRGEGQGADCWCCVGARTRRGGSGQKET